MDRGISNSNGEQSSISEKLSMPIIKSKWWMHVIRSNNIIGRTETSSSNAPRKICDLIWSSTSSDLLVYLCHLHAGKVSGATSQLGGNMQPIYMQIAPILRCCSECLHDNKWKGTNRYRNYNKEQIDIGTVISPIAKKILGEVRKKKKITSKEKQPMKMIDQLFKTKAALIFMRWNQIVQLLVSHKHTQKMRKGPASGLLPRRLDRSTF